MYVVDKYTECLQAWLLCTRYLREVFRDEKRVSLAAGRFATRSTFVLWRVFR